MRITNAQTTALMHNSMSKSAAELSKLMQQMATAQRMLRPSDDPIASVRGLRVQREQSNLTQYRANIDNVSGSLSIQEANFKSTSDAILNVRDLLLWAANGANTADDLGAIAGELSNIEQTIFSFTNARDEEGRYLFSGTLSDTPAIVFDSVTETYTVTGNNKFRQAAVANGVLVAENITVLEAFGPGAGMLNELHNLVKTLQDPLLNTNDPALRVQLEDTLNKLDATHKGVMGAISELGGRQNTLTLLTSSNEDVSLVNKKIEGKLYELDYAGASIDLKNYQMSLQATQKTYLKINELSLFSML